jgi:hypothetical protein
VQFRAGVSECVNPAANRKPDVLVRIVRLVCSRML